MNLYKVEAKLERINSIAELIRDAERRLEVQTETSKVLDQIFDPFGFKPSNSRNNEFTEAVKSRLESALKHEIAELSKLAM